MTSLVSFHFGGSFVVINAFWFQAKENRVKMLRDAKEHANKEVEALKKQLEARLAIANSKIYNYIVEFETMKCCTCVEACVVKLFVWQFECRICNTNTSV